MTFRLHVNINDETGALLRELSEREGRTVTEIVRRMASVYKFVTDECVYGDNELHIVAKDGSAKVVSIV